MSRAKMKRATTLKAMKPKKKAAKYPQPKLSAKEKKARKLSVKRREDPITLFSLYCHVSNSGVTFKVVDEGFGPTLVIKSGAFGNLESVQRFHLTKETLALLGQEIQKAANFKFTEDYCEAAEASSITLRGLKEVALSSKKALFSSSDSDLTKDG